MSKPPPQAEFPTICFPSPAAFTSFLEREHATAPGIFLKFAKKASGIQSITAAEAVEVALCYGWIDGRANPVDSKYWTIRYTPRRAKSIWSQKNVDTVGRLIEDGRMQPAGLEKVEAAKRDGRWERAYGVTKVPEDLEKALEGHKVARDAWEVLGKAERSAMLYKIATASVKGRDKCLEKIVGGLTKASIPGTEATTAKSKLESKEAGKSRKAVVVKGVKPTGIIKEKVVKKLREVLSKIKFDSASSLREDQVDRCRREGLRPRS